MTANARDLELLAPQALLGWAIERFGRKFAVVTSFQDEGMAILDMAVRISPAVRLITIDTGRLPRETHGQIDAVRRRYGVRVEVLQPDPEEIAAMTDRYGADLMYQGHTERSLCCHLRKVRPLERALEGLDAWAVGLRRGQSEARREVRKVEIDGGRWKLSPLADWTREQVLAYLGERNVPRHPLYEQGYASIGCDPCTRAVAPGEPERSGRWWWETDSDKECGLHAAGGGVMRRRLDVLLEEVFRATHA